MLAASALRGEPVDTAVMGTAFAQRGLGADASSKGGADTDPVGGYASPVAADNGTVTFAVKDAATGAPVAGEVYLGVFQARVTPFLRRRPRTPPSSGRWPPAATTSSSAPTATACSAGCSPSTPARRPRRRSSWPATSRPRASGATISGDGVRLDDLIDDNEASDGGYDGSATSTPVAGKASPSTCKGTQHACSASRVSALHHPVERGRRR